LICTAINVICGGKVAPYRTTHINHPCAIWARESRENFLWLHSLLECLNREYKHRYKDKDHLAYIKVRDTSIFYDMFPDAPFTAPPLCMPDHCKLDDPVESYRKLYNTEKRHLFGWKNREIPYWIK